MRKEYSPVAEAIMPALMIDEKVVSVGKVLKVKDVEKLL